MYVHFVLFLVYIALFLVYRYVFGLFFVFNIVMVWYDMCNFHCVIQQNHKASWRLLMSGEGILSCLNLFATCSEFSWFKRLLFASCSNVDATPAASPLQPKRRSVSASVERMSMPTREDSCCLALSYPSEKLKYRTWSSLAFLFRRRWPISDINSDVMLIWRGGGLSLFIAPGELLLQIDRFKNTITKFEPKSFCGI